MSSRIPRDFARHLRREMTDAERLMWRHLRARRFAREKFRRQEPMGDYVVDFVSHRSRLIIELDGGQHAERAEYDIDRTRWLEGQGYRVLRFWNNLALTETESVLEAIEQELLPAPSSPQRDEAEVRVEGRVSDAVAPSP
ncbi:endonuclease domain-containing protein [Aquisphaera insulae]|uniref:endonuclease domain-containing protein n=1 Tax=Aquisphaera insulae TaxID=2712864 RepID=UPI00211002E5|nr:endonuclease domain-containing protein [Aquisphaera insulae]